LAEYLDELGDGLFSPILLHQHDAQAQAGIRVERFDPNGGGEVDR
jgi:hypothetical protein